MLQALLEQVKKDAVLLQSKQAEIHSKDEKIQALTYELAYLRRIRYGVKSETFSQLQADLFADTWNEDVAAVEAELDNWPITSLLLLPTNPNAHAQAASHYRRICRASISDMNLTRVSAANVVVI